MQELSQRVAQALMQRLFIELEASGRHVHLTREAALALFGHGLTEKRPLSQPGQFVCNERVSLVMPRGRFDNVAVLGPERPQSQVELSLTDCVTLGLKAPVRLSGKVENTPGIVLVNGTREVFLPSGVIVAQRHIHQPFFQDAGSAWQRKGIAQLNQPVVVVIRAAVQKALQKGKLLL